MKKIYNYYMYIMFNSIKQFEGGNNATAKISNLRNTGNTESCGSYVLNANGEYP